MKKTELRNYARLIARVGANIKKGDFVVIRAELDQPEFVEMTVKECYLAGAAEVKVDFSHQRLTKLHTRYRSVKTLCRIDDWEVEKMKDRVKVKPAMIYLTSEDPDGLAGVDQKKLLRANQARYKAMKPFIDQLDNQYKWCIAAVPGRAWAKKIFPDCRTSVAEEKLWEAILSTSRARGDAIANWEAHNASFKKRCEYLNSLGITRLKYDSDNGTHLEVGLIEDSMFLGGGEHTLSGEFFNPNIPTEEVFISPKKGVAEGIVYATKPLSYRGELICDFSVRFENGRAVEVHAEKNEELLRQMISTDEGAAYLGECAIVPYNSPINETGLLFYNTLFDENACCHLALGSGFTNCIRDYDKYTLDQLHEKGINDSMNHVDFMIGSPDLKIRAVTAEGEEILIFDGVWKI